MTNLAIMIRMSQVVKMCFVISGFGLRGRAVLKPKAVDAGLEDVPVLGQPIE